MATRHFPLVVALVVATVLTIAAAHLPFPSIRAAPAAPADENWFAVQADTWIDEYNLYDSHGSDTDLYVGFAMHKDGKLYRHWTLLRFDLTKLPPGASINWAVLQLYQNGGSGDGTAHVWAEYVTDWWDEPTVNWYTQPGAVDLGDVRGPMDFGIGEISISVTEIVSAWAAGAPNYGILVRSAEKNEVIHRFTADTAHLYINYSPPAPTATPTRTATLTPTRTSTATATRTPTPTATVTRTTTPTSTATRTTTPADTPTATRTATRTPTATASRTLTPTATATRTPTATASRTLTPTATATRTPTATASVTPSTGPGRISGYVYGPGGGPLKDVALSLTCPDGSACGSATSSSTGAYSFAGLAPGEYRVATSFTGYYDEVTGATVRPGDTTAVNFYLRRVPTPAAPPTHGGINGTVTDATTHEPVVGAWVELTNTRLVWDPYYVRMTTTTNAQGRYTFPTVYAGTWRVKVRHIAYVTPPSATTTIYTTDTRTVNFTMTVLLQPPDDPTSDTDLTVRNVMVTQAIQRWDNSLPIVKNHLTELRAFIDLGGRTTLLLHPVYAKLVYNCGYGENSFYRSAVPRPVSDWSNEAQRNAVLADANATINFSLPPECTAQGTRTFTIMIESPPNIAANRERRHDNNSYTFPVTFQHTVPLVIEAHPMSLREDDFCIGDYVGPPSGDATLAALRLTQRWLPTSVSFDLSGTIDVCASIRTDGPWEYYPGWWAATLQFLIETLYLEPASLTGWPGGAVRIAYGALNRRAECSGHTCSSTTGMSYGVFQHHAFVGNTESSRHNPDVSTAPHEIGHTRWLFHAGNEHGEDKALQQCETWRYPHQSIGAWGFEYYYDASGHVQQKVYSPIPQPNDSHPHEMMSYGDSRWVSDLTWNRLYNVFRTGPFIDARGLQIFGSGCLDDQGDTSFGTDDVANAGDGTWDLKAFAQQAPLAEQSYLLVGGALTGPSTAEIYVMRPVSSTQSLAAQPAGTVPLAMRLHNASGAVLLSQPFAPAPGPDKAPGFLVTLPYRSDARSLTVISGTQVIATEPLSPHPPSVRILSPNGGESFTDSMAVTWEASDPDGDALSFDIYYSPDGGDTWTAVRSMVKGTQYTVDLTGLPGGGQARLRVNASDGMNLATDLTDGPFSVSRKPPQAMILQPVNGASYASEDLVVLEGLMVDPEDKGPYDDAQFGWTSNLDGILAAGQNTSLTALSTGRHVITLTVTDNDGNAATATATIFVNVQEIYLPLVLKQ